MDSVIPTNQKDAAICRDESDDLTDHLIELAKGCPPVQAILVKALVNPADNLGPPTVEARRLLRALKVADLAGSTVHWKRGDACAFDRWRAVQELLVRMVRDDLQRPMLSTRDVLQLKLCLEKLQPWCGNTAGIDWKCVAEDLKLLEDTAREYARFPKTPPQRGRRLSEHQKRIIAAVELLQQCGVRDPCQKVVEALYSWGISRESKTVMNLWSRYKKYGRRHPEREALPGYCIKGTLRFVVPEVKAWIETQAKKGQEASAPGSK